MTMTACMLESLQTEALPLSAAKHIAACNHHHHRRNHDHLAQHLTKVSLCSLNSDPYRDVRQPHQQAAAQAAAAAPARRRRVPSPFVRHCQPRRLCESPAPRSRRPVAPAPSTRPPPTPSRPPSLPACLPAHLPYRHTATAATVLLLLLLLQLLLLTTTTTTTTTTPLHILHRSQPYHYALLCSLPSSAYSTAPSFNTHPPPLLLPLLRRPLPLPSPRPSIGAYLPTLSYPSPAFSLLLFPSHLFPCFLSSTHALFVASFKGSSPHWRSESIRRNFIKNSCKVKHLPPLFSSNT